MKRAVIFLFLTYFSFGVISQSCLPFKERFDWLLYKTEIEDVDNGIYERNWFYRPDEGQDCFSGANAGEGMPYIINGWLKLYDVTHDKGYLFKAMNEFIRYNQARNDHRPCDFDYHASGNNYAYDMTVPMWSSLKDNPPFYFTGYTLMPMCKFLYMVRTKEPGLLNIQIPDNMGGISAYASIGDFSDVLLGWVIETYNYIQVNWDIPRGGYVRDVDGNYELMIINMQSQFALAAYYLYYASGDVYYWDIFTTIRSHYIGTYNRYYNCHNYGISNVFMYDQSNNAYYWEDQAWQDVYYDGPCKSYSGFQDISHANSVLEFPKESSIGDAPSYAFIQGDMIRWHNTFTKKLWKGSGSNEFYNSVNGDDNYSIQGGTGNDPNHFPINFMNYMPFERFDSLPGTYESVYNIVMNAYSQLVYMQEDNYDFLGQQMSGLADIIVAQWRNECPDLTLKNRGIIYDQDFFAKNILTVNPECQQLPIFEPRDSLYNNVFVIEPDVSSVMTAGNSVRLMPGFHAKEGSYFRATIDEGLCNPGQKNHASFPHGGEQYFAQNNCSLNPSVNIRPNPAIDVVYLDALGFDNSKLSAMIYNSIGQIVRIFSFDGFSSRTINVTGLPAGVYYINLEDGSVSATSKIVICN